MPCKVLVVDDEPFIREMVRSFLACAGADFPLAGESINGSAALEFMSRNPVDIVIADIRMPVMDGIALIREAGIRGYPARFIVLSAYSDFPLVKEAFKLGAGDYLLKSEMTREELLASLRRMSADRGRRARALARMLEGGGDAPVVASPGVAATGVASGEVFRSLEAGKEEYRVMFVRHFGAPGKGEAGSRSGSGGGTNPLPGWIQRSFEELGGEETIFTEWGDTGAVILPTGCREEELFASISERAAEKGFQLAGGISPPSRDPSELRQLFLLAGRLCSLYFYHGRGRLLSNLPAVSGKGPAAPDLSARPEELRRLVALCNADRLSERIHHFTVRISWPSIDGIAAIRSLFGSYHDILASALAEDPDEISSRLKELLGDFDSRIRESGTLDDYNEWISAALEAYCRALGSRSRLVRKVLEIVGSEYAKDLYLSQIARRLEVSESWLSRMFSREMNCCFTVHLTKVRMENALRLLRTTELRIYEIAEKTGYPNVEHFSRTFKKILGRSPKEFR